MKKRNFILLCCFVYFTSVITRTSLSVVIIEVIADLSIKADVASIAITSSFVSYCIGQLISGYLGDKFHPKSILLIGIITSVFTNLSITFVTDIYVIIVIWTINGFAHSLTWPPLVKMLAINLNNQQYKKACAYVTISGPIGTCILYLLAPFCVGLQGYKLLFVVSSILAVISAFLWFLKAPYYKEEKVDKKNENTKISVFKLIIDKGLIAILLAIVIHGILRDGVATWVPNFISENFKMSNINSILATTLLPVLSIFVVIIVKQINNKVKNEIDLSVVIFAVAFLSSLLLIAFKENFVISLVSISMLSACMHGVNLLLIGNLPIIFLKYGKVSTLSGVLNACGYIGSSVSAYAIVKISQQYSWDTTVIIWSVLCLLAVFLCISKRKNYKHW